MATGKGVDIMSSLKRLAAFLGLLGVVRAVTGRQQPANQADEVVEAEITPLTVAGPHALDDDPLLHDPAWLAVAKDVLARIKRDQIGTHAAALAYYGLLSAFPALIALVTLYGLVADPADVRDLVTSLPATIPDDVVGLIEGQLTTIASASNTGLGIGVVISVLAVLWTASNGIKSLVRAINVIHDESETRSAVQLRALSYGLTFAAIIAVAITIAALTFVPAWLGSIADWLGTAASISRWPVLGLLLMGSLALLYRYAPARLEPALHWTSWGAVLATAIWLVVSAGFAFYAANFGTFNETYGALGGVIVLMLWMFLSAAVILVGAEINESISTRNSRLKGVGTG